MRGSGAFTLSLVDVVIGYAGVILAVLFVLLWVWVAGPSGVDVTNILIKAVGVAWISLKSANHERQPAALMQAPDIHSNVILISGRFQRPSVYLAVCNVTIQKLL